MVAVRRSEIVKSEEFLAFIHFVVKMDTQIAQNYISLH